MRSDTFWAAVRAAEAFIEQANKSENIMRENAEFMSTKRPWEVVDKLEWQLTDMTKSACRARLFDRLLPRLLETLEGSAPYVKKGVTVDQALGTWCADTANNLCKMLNEQAARCLGHSTSASERFVHLCDLEVMGDIMDSHWGILDHINRIMEVHNAEA